MFKKIAILVLCASLIPAFSAWAKKGPGNWEQSKGTRSFGKKGHGQGFRHGKDEKVIAHRQQQKEENKAFHQSLKDLPEDQRSAAMKEHHNMQHQENIAFAEQVHAERIAKLQNKLDQNEKMTPEKKAEILTMHESRYQEHKAKREQRYQENTAFLQSLHDSGLSPDEIRDRMQERRKAHQQENRNNRQKKKSEWKQTRREMRNAFQGDATPDE